MQQITDPTDQPKMDNQSINNMQNLAPPQPPTNDTMMAFQDPLEGLTNADQLQLEFDFEYDARERFDLFQQTSGEGYEIFLDLIPQRGVLLPGFIHGLVTHLIAIDHHLNPPTHPLDAPNPYAIRNELLSRLQLVVPVNVILAATYEFLRFPVTLQEAWRIVNFRIPPYLSIPEQWRVILDDENDSRRHGDNNASRLEDQRRRLVQANDSPEDEDDDETVIFIDDDDDGDDENDDGADYYRSSPRSDPTLAHIERREALRERLGRPSDRTQRLQQGQNQQRQQAAEPAANPTIGYNGPAALLRNLARRLSARTSRFIPRRRNQIPADTNIAGSAVSRRSESPPNINPQLLTRQRSPLPPVRRNTISGRLTRMFSTSINRATRRRYQYQDEDEIDVYLQEPRRSRSRSPTDHDQFVGMLLMPDDRDHTFEDLLRDSQSNLILPDDKDNDDDADRFSFYDAPSTPTYPAEDTRTPAEGVDFLNLVDQPHVPIEVVDLTTVTNPLSGVGQPVRHSYPSPDPPFQLSYPPPDEPTLLTPPEDQSEPQPQHQHQPQPRQQTPARTRRRASTSATTTPSARSSTGRRRTARQTPQAQPRPARNLDRRQSQAQTPTSARAARTTGRRQSRTSAATQQTTATLPAGPVIQPVYLPRARTVPENPFTLPPNATPQQISYFKSIWRTGDHVPDYIPGHVFQCRDPGCSNIIAHKREMLRHYRRVHGGERDMNRELPRPARKNDDGSWTFVDGNERETASDGEDDKGDDDGDGDGD